jgi:hypothetical protein
LAVCLSSPGVLADGINIAHCDFGLWRPRYERHAYRDLKVFHTNWAYYAETGTLPNSSSFPAPLDPTDDQPPVTAVTYLGPSRGGKRVVRGVSVDDGIVRAVRVNGCEARSLAFDYSQWEVELEQSDIRAGSWCLSADAVDAVGNVERVPHLISIPVP